MPVITGIQEQQKRRDRVNVFLDGGFAFAVGRFGVVKFNLHVGQEIEDDTLQRLEAEAALEDALDAAKRLLGYRPRSEAELRFRLRRKGYSAETIDAALDRLKEQGLVNDKAFARFWKESRTAFRPRSKRMLSQELRGKGIPAEIIEEVSQGVNDAEEAYRAAQRKAQSLSQADFQAFHRRLLTFLRGRGFSYDVASSTTRRLWQEIHEGSEE